MPGPDPNEPIGKGNVLTKLDRLVASTPIPAAIQYLEQLEKIPGDGPELLALASELAFLTPEEIEHLERDWFSRDGWWADLQPVQPIFHAGFVKALDRALRDPDSCGPRKEKLPLDSYWIRAGNTFKVAVMQSPQQVTLVILTPRPPASPTPTPKGPESNWLFE